MLAQSLSLAFLAFLIGVLPLAALLGDALLAARWASVPAALALGFGCWAQVRVMRVHVQREVNRLNWRPASVIDQPPLPAPIPAEPAVIKSESVRLIPVHHAGRTYATSAEPVAFQSRQMIDGVDVRDLTYFIELLPAKGGHQRRRWLGTTLPSGRKVDADYYESLVAPLVKCKAIVGRAPRVAGTLTCSPQTIKERLQLAP